MVDSLLSAPLMSLSLHGGGGRGEHFPTTDHGHGLSTQLRLGKEAAFHENMTSSSSVPTSIPDGG